MKPELACPRCAARIAMIIRDEAPFVRGWLRTLRLSPLSPARLARQGWNPRRRRGHGGYHTPLGARKRAGLG